MEKLDCSLRTLDDEFIKDGSCAVATLEDNPFSRGLYFVVGGIATQSYLPSSCRRPTSDIDLAVLINLSYADFKEFSKTAFEYLGDEGYDVKYRKAHRSFCIDFTNKERNIFFIEFARDSEKTFDAKKKILERERAHAKSKIIEGTASTYIVASPEDIIIPKLARSTNSLKRNDFFECYVNGMKNFSKEEIRKNLNKIRDLRLEATLEPGNVEGAEILRFVSDLYDIRLLSELAGVNNSYLKESAHDWISLNYPSFQRDLIARAVLPEGALPENSKW